jgi:hypothetical protein
MVVVVWKPHAHRINRSGMCSYTGIREGQVGNLPALSATSRESAMVRISRRIPTFI